eukprot:m.91705 g.91705  ORF g.91705 m.91705 type:complete len:180 (+) comp12957_c0_seq4:1077-1616(+)
MLVHMSHTAPGLHHMRVLHHHLLIHLFNTIPGLTLARFTTLDPPQLRLIQGHHITHQTSPQPVISKAHQLQSPPPPPLRLTHITEVPQHNCIARQRVDPCITKVHHRNLYRLGPIPLLMQLMIPTNPQSPSLMKCLIHSNNTNTSHNQLARIRNNTNSTLHLMHSTSAGCDQTDEVCNM